MYLATTATDSLYLVLYSSKLRLISQTNKQNILHLFRMKVTDILFSFWKEKDKALL